MFGIRDLLRFSLSVISFSAFVLRVDAQQKVSLESLIPPAPNAAELGKYGTYPVGLVTGIPDISFPLFQVSSGSLKLPISISYHASGNRVNDKSTDLGLGWSVIAGGQIARTVYSAADDGQYGYFNYTPSSYNTLLALNNYYTMATYNIVGNAGYDLEPDLFAYNIGGKSGKFHCDANKNFVTVPFEPIKIQKCACAGGKTGFQITDDNGVIYNFYNYGTSYTEGSPLDPNSPIGPRTTISSWYLTSMISPDFADTISFVYDTQITHDVMQQFVHPIGEDNTGMVLQSDPTLPTYIAGSQKIESDITYTELLIKQINFKNGYIKFNRNTARKDYDQGSLSYSLDEMIIFNTGNQIVKRFTFNHDYFLASPFYDDAYHYRLKLTGFVESDSSKMLNKTYKFDYNTTQLPPYNSFGVDYWGFYNGTGNVTLIPSTTAYYHDFGATTIRGVTYTNPHFIGTDYTSTFNLGDANREPSAAYMNAGILSKITYPTGGYSTFEFEPHQYTSDNYLTQSISKNGGATGINKYTKSTSTYNFTYPSDASRSSVNLNPVIANVTINFSVSNMTFTEFGPTQTVTLMDASGATIQSWTHTGDLTVPLTINAKITLSPGATYTFESDVYGDNTVSANSSVNWTENLNQHATKIGGGLRIKSIKDYGFDNALLKEENYVYGVAESGVGTKLFDEQVFYKNYEDVVLSYYGPVVDHGSASPCFNLATVWQRRFMGISKYNSVNYMGSPVLYPTVTKYEGSTLANAGKTISTFGITIDPNNFPPEFVNSGNYGIINNAWHQGELVDETSYKNIGGQYFPVSKIYYQYGGFNYRADTAVLFKQFKQFIKTNGPTSCNTDPTGPEPTGPAPGQGFFSVYGYLIKSGAYRKTKETKVVYDQQNPSGSIASVITTQYNNPANLYPTQSTITTSDMAVTKITRLKYPQDTTDAVSTAMVARNMLNPVLQVKNSKSVAGTETLLSTNQTIYKQVGNLIVRDNIKVSTGLLAPETRIQFNKYDSCGNIVEQQKASDVRHNYIWDYKSSYPIAEAINADSVNIAYTSFEAEGNGGWSIGSTLRSTNSGITGQQSYNLSNGACTKSGLSTASTYIVSYWSNTGSSYTVSSGTPVKQGKTVNGWTYFEHQVTGTGVITVSGSGNIDELRLYPAGAQMTTYTYAPLTGMTSQCDVKNKITYYEYDGLGRLKDIKDQDGNIIRTNQYHYLGQ